MIVFPTLGTVATLPPKAKAEYTLLAKPAVAEAFLI